MTTTTARERLNLADRSLDELYAMRDGWALDVDELAAVNDEIAAVEDDASPEVGPEDGPEVVIDRRTCPRDGYPYDANGECPCDWGWWPSVDDDDDGWEDR